MTPASRHRLTLIVSSGDMPELTPSTAPSITRLAHLLVDAARDWSALASTLSEVINTDTEEGRLRLAVLDRVHDLEHAETNLAARPSGMRPLFGEGPG